MATSYATIRRHLAQRLKFWGGAISADAAATTSDTGGSNTLIDTVRTEDDTEWDNAWVVLNPGSTDQVNAPTIWRRVASENGWIQSTGTLTIKGTWPAPYASGVGSGVSYELYKVFLPQDWLDALNYAINDSYPQRHRAFNIQVPQEWYSRVVDYAQLAKAHVSLTDPTTAPTVTEIADGQGAFQPGVYTFAYTFYNEFGETKQSNTTNLTVAGTNSRVQFANITSIPAAAVGVNYYASLQPGDTTLDQLSIGDSQTPTGGGPPSSQNLPAFAIYEKGKQFNGTAYAIQFRSPNPWFGVSPPSYNTTVANFFRLHAVLRQINPGQFPQIYNELPGDMWAPFGSTKVMFYFWPTSQYSLNFLCTTQPAAFAAETDSTDEPDDLLMWGAEYYLWMQFSKTSTILNTNWQQLAKTAKTEFESLKNEYRQDLPNDAKHWPLIRAIY